MPRCTCNILNSNEMYAYIYKTEANEKITMMSLSKVLQNSSVTLTHEFVYIEWPM